jgi:excisionase family DNA binding protein
VLPTPQERPTLTVQEVAKILGLGRDKAYQLVKDGTIPSISTGKRYLVPTSSLWQFLNIPTPETHP